MSDRTYIEIPGNRTHELPPLLIHREAAINAPPPEELVNLAADIVEAEDMIPSLAAEQNTFEQRKYDLALQLVEKYLGLVAHWQWGDSILEWIRQCETTFETRIDLRNLLRADLWPHAGRSSFVMLLEDKAVETGGIGIEKAVGMRLTFRHPPPLKCFSNQFLFYLNSPVASSAYQTWAGMTPSPVSALPPERFMFQVVNMSVD